MPKRREGSLAKIMISDFYGIVTNLRGGGGLEIIVTVSQMSLGVF